MTRWTRSRARAAAWSIFQVLACLPLLAACLSGGGGTGSASVQPAATGGAVASVRITPETRQIALAETATFTAEALDAKDNVLPGRTFTFSSSRPDVASIANPAANPVTVTAITAGVSRINVSVEGKTAQATLTVGGPANVEVSGRVIDAETGAGIAGARVERINGTFVTAGGDGSFSYMATSSSDTDELIVRGSGYVSSTVAVSYSTPTTHLAQIPLVRDTGVPGIVIGTLRNARDNLPIAGGQVWLAPTQGALAPIDSDRTTTTNAQGQFAFVIVPRGVYSLIGRVAGYVDCSRTAISVTSATTFVQDLHCSPASGTEIRIVLTWGANPSDLDAHLTGPRATGSDRFHIYYATRGATTGDPFALLDVDATRAFGPETITLTRLNGGVYRFSVHDFSNRTSTTSTALAASGAKVEVYLPTSTAPLTFNVPNQRGTLWTAFEITGTMASPVVTPRNDMGFVQESQTVQ